MPRALRALKARLGGHTHPQLVECDDGRRYVIKCPDGRAGRRGVIAELVGHRLAALLGVPTPGDDLVHPAAGSAPCFGSLYVEGSLTGKAVERYGEVQNREAFAAVLVLDHWLGNRQGSRRNVLLAPEPAGGYRLLVIDMERFFLADCLDRRLMGRHAGRVEVWPVRGPHAAFLRHVAGWGEFEGVLSRLESLREEDLGRAVRDLPPTWDAAEEEKEALLPSVSGRRPRVRPALGALWAGARA